MPDTLPIYETLSEAASRWNISTKTLRRLIEDDHLEAFRLPGESTTLRVRVGDVDACFTSTRAR